MKKNKLLVHACCAPCLVAIYEDIENNFTQYGIMKKEDFDIIWYNINIHPKKEYELRRDTLKQFLNIKDKEGIFIDEYNLLEWTKRAVNYDKEGYRVRCEYCYTSRLEKVFEYAKENGYTHVTTSLLISPYQKHDIIVEVCKKLANKYNVNFLYKDFRPMFWDGQHRAKELGLYRQKYCGCIFSIDEGGKNKKEKINEKKK